MDKQTSDLANEARKRLRPATGYRLAKTMQVDTDTAYAWLKGRRTPKGKNLLKLIRLAGKSLSVLLLTAGALFSSAEESKADVRPPFDRSIHYTNVLRCLIQSLKKKLKLGCARFLDWTPPALAPLTTCATGT